MNDRLTHQLTQPLSQILEQWRHRKHTLPGGVGIYWYEGGLSLTYLRPDPKSKQPPEVLAKQQIVCRSLDEKQAAIAAFVAEHELANAKCSVCVGQNDYKITLLDAPVVSEKELASAVRWLIRDVITFPLEEAAIDVFRVPLPRARDNVNLVYVITMHNSKILDIERAIQPSGLLLEHLTTPEFAIRSGLGYQNQAKGEVVIFLQGQQGKFILLAKNLIYLVRNFELPEDPKEGLAIELQRYLDYANSLFRRNLATRCYLLQKNEIPGLTDYLKGNLEFELETLNLLNLFPSVNVIQPIQELSLFMAIGAGIDMLSPPETNDNGNREGA